MKKILVVVSFALVALMFLVGYIIGIRDNTKSITNPILEAIAPKIISKLEGNPQTLDTLLSCSNKDNCTNETSEPPYQWLRYAQYYYDKAFKQTIPTEEILSDLFLYTDNIYYQRLYQYGDIIIDSQIADSKYQQKYLELFDKSIHPSYLNLIEGYSYITKSNPVGVEKLIGSQISQDKNNGVIVMDYSTNAVAAANAYLMTEDVKYLNALNNYLNLISLVYYFDGVSTTAIENSPKFSACYSLLATAKAFSVTQDKQYLQLSDDMILGTNNYLQQLYLLVPDKIELFSTNPMNVLPCLDALNMLEVYDLENSPIYTNTYSTIIEFLINNKIINTTKDSESYGMMNISDKLDINSTAWLVKILSENIINNGK